MAANVQQPLVLGKGVISLAKAITPGAVANGFRPLGNCPSLTISIEEETLDHYDSRRGIKQKDYTATLQVNRSAEVTCDSIQPDNLALFFLGTAVDLTQTANAVATLEVFNGVIKGQSYVIGRTAASPAGISGLATVIVTSVPSGTTYVAGTDYVVYPALGLVEVLPSGTIANGTNIQVSYTLTAGTQRRIVSGSTSFEGAMMFNQDNAVGENHRYLFNSVRVRPSGDFELISDDWQTLTFTIEVLSPFGQEAFYVQSPLVA